MAGMRRTVKRRQHYLWSHLIWPLLWPWLLVQAVLVLLCLILQGVMWLAMPQPNSWADSFWLLLALLSGTALSGTAFLLQLRHRLRELERRGESRLEEFERLLPEYERLLPDWLKPTASARRRGATPQERLEGLHDNLAKLPSRLALLPRVESFLASSQRPVLLLHEGRIVSANRAMERLLDERVEVLVGADPATRLFIQAAVNNQLAEAQVVSREGYWRSMRVECLEEPPYELLLFERPNTHDYRDLVASRERAREESRLKSHYLSLLQRELEPLLAKLAQNMENVGNHEATQSEPPLHERIAELQVLIDSLAGDGSARLEPRGDGARAIRLHVLVVDDGPVNRALARQLLEAQGMRVDSVAGGAEALERQRRHTYDLVLLDIFMPGMDGVETARRWRDYEARTYGGGHAILIALTANAAEQDRQRFLSAGIDDYLAKPYGPRSLLDLLRSWRPDAFEEFSHQL